MRDNLMMTAIIKVDVDKNYPYQTYFDKFYDIPYQEDIDDYIDFFKKLGEIYNVPILRVYLSSNGLATPNNIWTKDKIESFFNTSLMNLENASKSSDLRR